jgi:hypothetical protein
LALRLAFRIAYLNQAVPSGLTVAGVSLITYGGWRLGNAYKRALSKSVWWYNRDLKKAQISKVDVFLGCPNRLYRDGLGNH